MKKSPSNKFYRCLECSQKLSFILSLTNQCMCGNLYCNNHLASEKHKCQFNYHQKHQDILRKNNPIIEAPKISNKI